MAERPGGAGQRGGRTASVHGTWAVKSAGRHGTIDRGPARALQYITQHADQDDVGFAQRVGTDLARYQQATGRLSDLEELLERADIAMYTAKETHAGFLLFDSKQDQHNPKRLALLGEQRRALEQRQLLLHYQPKVDAHNGRVLGVEALATPRPRPGPAG